MRKYNTFMDTDDTDLTEEELEKVNTIITGINTNLKDAIERLKYNDFDKALWYVNQGITKSNCPVCKKELSILIADITHNKQICLLNADSCKDEKKNLITTADELRNDFIPIRTKKRAIIEKKQVKEKTNIESKQPELSLPPDPLTLLASLINSMRQKHA